MSVTRRSAGFDYEKDNSGEAATQISDARPSGREGKISMTLEQALEAFNAEFSGWWWTLGKCHVSCDASIAPDRRGPDADLLDHRSFDDGFHVDLLQPSTVADALLAAMELARKARADCRAGAPLPDPAPPLAPCLSVLCDAWLRASGETKVEFMNWILDRHEQAAE
jgi:hypothetical protein